LKQKVFEVIFSLTNKFIKSVFLILLLGLLFLSSSNAQTPRTCNLKVKVFVYNASFSNKSLGNVEVILTNLKTKAKKSLILTAAEDVFENLEESDYRISLLKAGYKEKKKEIKLECGFAGDDNNFVENVYLWKDKSNSASETDLPEAKVESKNSTETVNNDTTKNVSQSQDSVNKSEKTTVKATGKVTVRVLIDTDGNVVSAKALDGNKLLGDAAVKGARKTKFAPTMLAGSPVQVTGDIIYNFVP
jgi:TonB family protein